MKALIAVKPGGSEMLRVAELAKPVPRDDELLVRVLAAGLNRADLLQRAGHYPAPPDSPQDILGLEYAGVVEATGPSASVARGTRVFGLVGGGAQAEFLTVREALSMRVPERVSDLEAGAIPEAYITAHDALFAQALLQNGERVLVHAIGSGVGIAAMQLAKAHGCMVFGTSRTPEKLERARSLGLDRAIDVSRSASFDAVVHELTGGRGVDVIIDFIGAPYLERNLNALAMRGRMVIVSTLGGVNTPLSLRTLMAKRLRIMGTMLRARPFAEKVAATAAFARDVLPLLQRREIVVPIERAFALDEAAAAHDYMAANRNIGKLVFDLTA